MGRRNIREAGTLVALLFAAAAILDASAANAAIEISTKPTANMNCSGGVCMPTARKAVLNVTDLAAMLATGDVTIKSDASSKDIEIDAALSWTSAQRLTLDAYRSIAFNKPIVVAGTGAMTITTNDGGSDGDYQFFRRGHVEFWDLSSNLIINGKGYVLIRSVHDIRGNSNVALARDYNAGRRIYQKTPIKVFESAFEGLGNTISHLTIHSRLSGDEVALFGQLIFNGTNYAAIRDLRLTSVDIRGTGDQQDVVALVGTNYSGTVINDYVDGQITATGRQSFVAGVIAFNSVGTTKRLSASVTVSASGDSSVAGGLIGYAEKFCIQFGGCFGQIEDSYASGTVSIGTNGIAGGLVGESDGGTVLNSYATSSVSGGDGSFVGGLVGSALDTPQSQATPITTASYSSGAVSGSPLSVVGGLFGHDEADSTNTSLYWDLDTSGVSDPSNGTGNIANDPGITGLSDAQLKSGLPSGFDKKVWKQSAAINNGYPYLIDNPPPR
ncbi:MAG TPA: GLUG motif-containing protein [Rhizomicrobium sp.]|nr:GLUG motif-containing protein [Rhizomicrobium sp.]